MDFLFSFLEQSLAFFPLVLGIYISFSILKRPDLTADGSFVLGAATAAKMTLLNYPILVVFIASAIAGGLCGVLTSLLQYKDKVPSLIAGIIVLFILQSFNLIFMGRPNINLLNQKTIMSLMGILPALCLAVGSMAILFLVFMYTKRGLYLRAFGCNSNLIGRLGKSKELYRLLGFFISNALIALSGSLTAQLNGYADISMGTGLVISGLAAVLVGLQLKKQLFDYKEHILSDLIGLFMGTLVYFAVIFYLSSLGINPLYLKLVIGCTLAVVLLMQHKKGSFKGVVA